MWELISFLQGRSRRTCLEQLFKGPMTPSQIRKGTGQHLSHISRALGELEEKGLVECVTPDASKNRFYRITSKGSKLLNELREIES